MNKDLLKRIESDPKVLCGKPVIRGTRISVELILEKLSDGDDFVKICKEYDLHADDIKAALIYASEFIANEEILEAL
ncbi:DUF433 domain-containing protein [bacterium]|nr:DUF433 domain-containing protein [bacterium]